MKSLNQREFREKELIAKIKKIEEKYSECSSLKKKLQAVEEEQEYYLAEASGLNESIKEDWSVRNMMEKHKYVFDENESILNRIRSERDEVLREGFEDLDQYMKKLSWEKEDCQSELRRLRDLYEREKKEDADGTHN